MKYQSILFLSLFTVIIINAQSDYSSPYSLYGLGKENINYFGGLSAMGNTGIGYKTTNTINKINPASLTSIFNNSFLYEVGFSSTYSLKNTTKTNQKNYDFNFTHIAMAFSIKDYWKTSFGLVPYTKVNYEIDLIKPIEGSTSLYTTNIIGSGGINEVFWTHGLKLTPNFSVGLEFTALFGSLDQEQLISFGSSSTYLKESNHYFGFGLNAGIQYTAKKFFGTETTFGGTLSLPSSLKGSQNFEGSKTYYTYETSLEAEEDISLEDFNLPLKAGIGISSKISKNLLINLDYTKNYWANTYTSNEIYKYSNQSFYAAGVEYTPSQNNSNYWNTVKYRGGVNYNSGYLTISNKKIDTYSISFGLGLPIAKNKQTFLNLNYSYGKEGTIEKQLIEDNFHKLSINLSLFGNWFQKQKIF